MLRGLVMARDEVLWLLRHYMATAPKAKSKPNMKLLRDP